MKPFIYYKTPKCASTSIETALNKIGIYSSENDAYEIIKNNLAIIRVGRDSNAYKYNSGIINCGARIPITAGLDTFEFMSTSWTVVRNPWAKVVSTYFDMQKKGYFSERHSFKQWVEFLKLINEAQSFLEIPKYCNCASTLPYQPPNCECLSGILNHTIPWHRSNLFYPDNQTPRKLDIVLRFENLNQDWKDLSDKLEIEYIELPRKNVQNHSDINYIQHYSHDLIQIIRQIYIYEINKYGYTFG